MHSHEAHATSQPSPFSQALTDRYHSPASLLSIYRQVHTMRHARLHESQSWIGPLSDSEVYLQAAIKFYLDKKAFTKERVLYLQPELRSMMPATLAIEENSSAEVSTPYGYVFPSFVIIECGQSLDEWARRNTADFITIFQVCHPGYKQLVTASGSAGLVLRITAAYMPCQ